MEDLTNRWNFYLIETFSEKVKKKRIQFESSLPEILETTSTSGLRLFAYIKS